MSLTLYKSSAGSGKTFTLVKEYLNLVIANPESYSHILAITFTNKAANEMKSRILSSLNGLAHGTDKNDLVEILELEFKQKYGFDDEALRKRAGMALSNILHGYSNFAVSTIDSFVHKLVRSFTRELNLPPNFEVELDVKKLISKSIDMLISKVGQDGQLTHALVRFIESKMDDEKSWNIEIELKKFTEILLKESSLDPIKKLQDLEVDDFMKISKQIKQFIRAFESDLKIPATNAMNIITQNNLPAEYFYQAKSGIYPYFDRIVKGDFDKLKANSYVLKFMDEDKFCSGKCPPHERAVIEGIAPELKDLCQQIQQIVEERMPQATLFGLILQNIYSMAVLNEIDKVMEDFRVNENIVHISEFNKRIAGIVALEPVPFIYERLGEKYHHFLLDEFQDTSVLQWHNLLPLLENSLAADHFNMIVGDGKQAIYRWRSGEVEQFAALPKIYNRPNDIFSQQRESLFASHFVEKVLDRNYRSKKEIVEFNNEFFDFAAKGLDEDLFKIYQSQEQKVDPQKVGGSVHIEFIDKLEDNDELLEFELERILQIVKDQRTEFNLRDIAVLVRTNDEGSAVARYLLENGMRVVTDEALWLSSSRNVNFIVAVLRYLNDPHNRINIGEILVYLSRESESSYQNLQHLFAKCKAINPASPDAVGLEIILKQEFKIEFDSRHLHTLTLFEIVDELTRVFNFNQQSGDLFIRFFMDSILEFSTRNDEGISEFLKHWDEKGHKDSVVVPDDTEAVKVMTIHKAKGLQFPVVIYPFAKGKSKIGSDELWVDVDEKELPELKTALVKTSAKLEETVHADLRKKELEKSFLDALNVLYVAMTRPSKRMFVLMHNKLNAKGEWKTANPFADNADLFHDFLVNENLWHDDQKTYIFGESEAQDEISKCEHDNFKDRNEVSLWPNLERCTWRDKITIGFKAPEAWDTETTDKNRDWGIVMHGILATINGVDDVDATVDEAVIEGKIEVSVKDKLIGSLREMINMPELKPFFDPNRKVYVEKDIILKSGHSIRPDRIVMDGEVVWVIDYKTGEKEVKHRDQLNFYAAALEEMAYQNINKCLIYLNVDASKVEVVKW